MAAGAVVHLENVEFAYPATTPTPPDRASAGPAGADQGAAFRLRIDDLQILPGERLAVIGASGAGKTTLVNLIAGLLRPAQGTVRVLGENLSELTVSARQRLRLNRIGMVFQDFELLEYLTALENILLPRWIGTPTAGLEARAHGLAVAAGVSHRLDRKPTALSQGERQRVGLCRALATRPELILCDEPTGNLDPDSTRIVLDLLLEESRTSGAAVVMITHNHTLLPRFDRVLEVASRGSFNGSSCSLVLPASHDPAGVGASRC